MRPPAASRPVMPDQDAKDDTSAVWAPVLAVLGGVVGSAAWISFVGGVVLAARFDRAGVPPGPTVSLIPTEQQVVVGLRFVAFPVLLALAAFLLLLAVRPANDNEGANRATYVPKGLKTILTVGAGLAVYVGVQSNLEKPLAEAVVLALPVVAGILIYYAVKKVGGFARAGLILFVGVAACAGIVAAAYEYARPPTLDLAAVLRPNGSGIGGFYIGKTDTNLYLITPTRAGGPTTGKAATKPLPINASRCETKQAVARLSLNPPRR